MLRITAGLDVKTVLGEVVESALSLTGARYGIIATVDEAGQPLENVNSGFTAEEEHELTAWADARRLFEHLLDQPDPLRIDDLPE